MMPFMCDSLLPVEERHASLKYRRLSRWFNPYRQLGEDNIEVRAMLLTPGLTREHVFALMRWNRNMVRELKPLEALDSEAQPLVLANAHGVDQADGRAMLVTILGNFPNWSRSVPLWSTRYLQTRRRRGAGISQLAAEFGTTTARMARWWRADLFDPLTGLPRDAATLGVGWRPTA